MLDVSSNDGNAVVTPRCAAGAAHGAVDRSSTNIYMVSLPQSQCCLSVLIPEGL